MGSIWQRTRLAGVAGAALAVLATGVVAGAAGGAIIMGAANSAGTTNTSLTTTSTGTAFLSPRTVRARSFRASATGPGSIAGFYTSTNGPGVSGVTAGATSTVSTLERCGNDERRRSTACGRAEQQVASSPPAAKQNAIEATASRLHRLHCCGRLASGAPAGLRRGRLRRRSGSLFGVEGADGLFAGVYGRIDNRPWRRRRLRTSHAGPRRLRRRPHAGMRLCGGIPASSCCAGGVFCRR